MSQEHLLLLVLAFERMYVCMYVWEFQIINQIDWDLTPQRFHKDS